MTKHISIHKAEYHKYYHTQEAETLLDEVIEGELCLYPIQDEKQFYLYDVIKKEIIQKSINIDSFNIENNTEIISFKGVAPSVVSEMKLPKKIGRLSFELSDSISSQICSIPEGDALWKKLKNLSHLYKFNESVDERILREKESRFIFNNLIPKFMRDFGLSKLFDTIDSSNIKELRIDNTYFFDSDFLKLSTIENIENLSIFYCYNNNIKWLPKNLNYLKIFGTSIQSLSELNLNLPNLVNLELEGNTLNNLDSLTELPKGLKKLHLGTNLITYLKVDELPEGLEDLDLSFNLINNGFFDQRVRHKNLKKLNLRDNEIEITSSVLNSILEIFPNLEYLELLDNKTEGISLIYMGESEDKNCLANVKFILEDIEYVSNGEELSRAILKPQKDFVEVNWREKTLPLKVVLSDIQYWFSKYFINMPSFSQHVNGIYCSIEHDNCELLILFEEERKEVTFKVQSDNADTVALYFHKYLHEIYDLISSNSHIDIWPSVRNSKSCYFLKEFCDKVFKVDFKIKSDIILKKENEDIKVLINNRSIEGLDEEGKFAGDKYEFMKNVAFVLVSGKSAYPFVLKNGVLTNALKLDRDYYYYLILRTALDKENYIKSITNKYLNSSKLVETNIYIDNDIKKKVSCFVNPNYFQVNDNTLESVGLDFPKLVEDNLKEIKMDNGKYCEFSIVHGLVELKYVN